MGRWDKYGEVGSSLLQSRWDKYNQQEEEPQDPAIAAIKKAQVDYVNKMGSTQGRLAGLPFVPDIQPPDPQQIATQARAEAGKTIPVIAERIAPPQPSTTAQPQTRIPQDPRDLSRPTIGPGPGTGPQMQAGPGIVEPLGKKIKRKAEEWSKSVSDIGMFVIKDAPEMVIGSLQEQQKLRGMTQQQFAQYIGFSDQDLQEAVAQDPQFLQKLEKANRNLQLQIGTSGNPVVAMAEGYGDFLKRLATNPIETTIEHPFDVALEALGAAAIVKGIKGARAAKAAKVESAAHTAEIERRAGMAADAYKGIGKIKGEMAGEGTPSLLEYKPEHTVGKGTPMAYAKESPVEPAPGPVISAAKGDDRFVSPGQLFSYAGPLAGIGVDDDGNFTYDLGRGLLGVAAGMVGGKLASKEFRAGVGKKFKNASEFLRAVRDPNGAYHYFFTAEMNKFKSPIAKRAVASMQNVQDEIGNLIGNYGRAYATKVRQIKLSASEEELLGQVLRGEIAQDAVPGKIARAARNTDKLFQGLIKRAQDAGIEVTARENYFPQYFKPEIRRALQLDMPKVMEELKRFIGPDKLDDVLADVATRDRIRAKMKAASDAERKKYEAVLKKTETVGTDLLERLNAMDEGQFSFSPTTSSVIRWAGENGLSFGETLEYLLQKVYNDPGFVEFSSFKARKLPFDRAFHETNTSKVVGDYINGWAKRIAEAEAWGPTNKGMRDMISELTKAMPSEGRALQGLYDVLTGRFARTHPLNPTVARAYENFANLELASKVGAGWATIYQITQPLISVIPKAGLRRTVKGAGKLLDSGYRERIRRTGAPTVANAAEMLIGEKFSDLTATGKIAKVASYPFEKLNTGLQYLAAATGEVYINDLYPIANKPSRMKIGKLRRDVWARQQLERLGIDASKPLTDKIKQKGMYRFAINTQLQRNVLRDQRWLNDPRVRPFVLFKRFGARQAEYIKNDIIMSEIAQGNVMPFARLLVGGALGGEGIAYGKRLVKELLSGEPQLDDKEFGTFEWFVDRLSQVGSMGLFGDIASVDLDNVGPDAILKFKFALEPLIASELERAVVSVYPTESPSGPSVGAQPGYLLEAVQGNWEKVIEQLAYTVPAAGPLGRRVTSSEKRKSSRIAYKRGTWLYKIANQLQQGNRDQARKLAKQWNDAYPYESIDDGDINDKLKRMSKSKAGG